MEISTENFLATFGGDLRGNHHRTAKKIFGELQWVFFVLSCFFVPLIICGFGIAKKNLFVSLRAKGVLGP